jgi:hypothetical protein
MSWLLIIFLVGHPPTVIEMENEYACQRGRIELLKNLPEGRTFQIPPVCIYGKQT